MMITGMLFIIETNFVYLWEGYILLRVQQDKARKAPVSTSWNLPR